MLIVYKGQVFNHMQDIANIKGMDIEYVEAMCKKLQDPNYNSSNWALVESTPEAIKHGILKTTQGWVFDLEIQKTTSENLMKTALETIQREATICATYEAEIAKTKKFIAKCIETGGYPDD